MKTIISLLGLALCMNLTVQAQGFDNITIEATKLTDKIYVLTGAGGNIGVSVGDDGVFIIDDQFAPLTAKIEAKLKTLSDKPIKYVVNTHFHGDHTGGNANMHNLGATIIAHDNVRERLANEPQRNGTLAPKEALPVITYNDRMSIHMNGEKVAIVHVDNAHTDGDSMLYFLDSNVLHTGDTYFRGWYPYIDLKSGGSVDGYIAAVKQGLMLIDDNTKIIPGHGGTESNKVEYLAYLEMLEGLKKIISGEIEKGRTEDEVANDTSLTKTYDDQGYSWQFITSEKIRRTFYKSLKQ
ncbi:MBL fold metallo-hydrolase [Winogradskyella sp. 3972H.M.0a.05]|uniref:MBL fold metallo-hydrolase n=1 Tax=Winogradskyella sp. 3972H.M.0a.05 TaxID=2950277 RepID=UPI00339445E9